MRQNFCIVKFWFVQFQTISSKLQFQKFPFLQSEFDYVFDEPQTRQCSEYEDKGYRCVPYYTCDECNAIIIDGAGLFDPRNTVDTCKTSRKIRTLKFQN